MPRNSAGTYTLPAGNPVVAGTTIDASWANDTMSDMANEITNSLSRTGAGGMLAPFRVADGSATTPGLGFTNETNTGLYRAGTGELWFTVGGVAVAQITANGLLIPSGKRISLPAPVNDTDAANKEYVDDLVNPVIQYANYYLGPKSSDPSVNNSGGALTAGTTYWSTTLNQLRVYNGTTWEPMPSTASVQGQTFSGTGAQTAFTLAAPTGNATNLEVFISGVRQVPTTDYTVSGTTLTFTSAPPSGTDNIYVRFAQLIALASADSSNISFLPAGTGAVSRTAQAKMRDVVSVKDFGAVGDGVANDTTAFNAAIAHANSKGGNDRANIIGTTIFIPEGRYRITAALNPVTVSSVYFVGASKGSAVILSTSTGSIFTFGDSTLANTPVGGGVSDVKIEYPSGPTGGATAFTVDYAFSLVFQDLMLENIGTLLSLGQSASRIAGGITVSNVQGSIANLGFPLFNLKYGAGLKVSDCGIFVRGVLAPVHPASMTTVYGTNVFKCDVGFWDTLEVSNCLFERFDIGVGVVPPANGVYQNFFFSNVIFDYFRRWCVYAEASAAGAVISTMKFSSTCWFVSWEEDAIALIRTNGFHDNHSISGTIPIAGKYGIKYQIGNGETNSFQNIQINGCNRLGTVASCLQFESGSRGFSVTNVKGNNDTTIGWTRPSYGIVVAADCDEFIVNGCALEGPVGGYSFAANASGSSQRRAFNNVKANYAGYSAIAMPASGVQYVNKTPFVQEWNFFGGTITGGYDKNGQGFPGALASLHIRLQPNDNFTCGYSVAPTVKVFIEP